MPKQVIVIAQNGALKGLEHKEGGVDLKSFGKAVVDRATSIEWDSELDGWYIRWEDTPDSRFWERANKVWGRQEYSYFKKLPSMSIVASIDEESGRILFKKYNDAVQVEIEVIQHLQKLGLM